MSSSEEYLDNLLKSLTEGGNSAGENAASPATQDMEETDGLQEIPAPEEADQTMSMDDIEAMFASIGVEAAAEEPQADETASPDTLAEASLLNDEIIPDELEPDDGTISDELVLDDSMVSDELVLDDSMVSDELVLDDGMVSDELVLDDSMMSDEPVPDESILPDELSMDGGAAVDDLVPSEEAALNDLAVSDEAAVDDLALSEEAALDDLALSEEAALDDLVPSEEAAVDDLVLSEEAAVDDLALSEEAAVDDLVPSEEAAVDDLALSEEAAVDDLVLSDEAAPDDFALNEEAVSNDITLEEAASDELSLEELGLGDLGLEALGLEERSQDESESGGDFALEENLGAEEDFALEEQLGTEEDFSLEGESGAEADFALEEGEEEDAELSALLASMGGDEDLSEINDLLEKSDQGVAIDDDMMAMLDGISEGEEGEDAFDFFAGEEEEAGAETVEGESENIREITPEELGERENSKSQKEKKKEEKEKKKREKQAKKAKKKGGSQDENADGEGAGDLNGLPESGDDGEEKPKKQGFFAKLMAFLLEEDDDDLENAYNESGDVGVVIGNLSEENKELLAELNAEDRQNAKKKNKKDKKEKKEKKDKKDKKGKAKGKEVEGEEDEAKPKKPKKEKKKKEKSVEEELKLPEKKLSKKKVISVFLFCATIAACIIVVTMLLPEQMEKQEARIAYDRSQYAQVYDLLYGKELSEEDEVLLRKSSIVLKMQRKLDSFENYRKLDMQLEALNALIEGVSRYRDLRDEADAYNVGSEVAQIYGRILDELANNYGLSESDAMDIISSGDNITYSQRLQAVISGETYGAEEEELEELPDVKQDVLPEEEEIIDRLQGAETE